MEKWKQEAGQVLSNLTLLLGVSYGLSWLSGLYWFFDLFSHFVIQYAFGGLLLGCGLLACDNKRYALLAFALMIANGAEIALATSPIVPNPDRKPDLTIVQYNRTYTILDHTPLYDWINENREKFDIIVLQEANGPAKQLAHALTDFYPHQILEPRTDAFGMVIISKYELVAIDKIDIEEPAPVDPFAIRVQAALPSGKNVEIYALHALPPVGSQSTELRNKAILTVGEKVQQSKAEDIIMIGDWNLTPYSPIFHQLTKTSGLKEYLPYGLPMPTWPSIFFAPMMQIPIDHVLQKGNLQLIDKYTGPAMGSDHYPLIASFAMP